jgi:hypothetical protein
VTSATRCDERQVFACAVLLSRVAEHTGQFRVYRGVEAVPHVNLQAVERPRLYSVYRSGYGDLQERVDGLRTGDLVTATLAGDPADDAEPWRLTAIEREGGVTMDFAVDVAPPEVAREGWTDGATEPISLPLTAAGEAVGVCSVQPRDPLPEGAFVPSVVSGLLPLEGVLAELPELGAPATEALFLDPDPPGATAYSLPYGVALLFTERGRDLADEFRARYDCPRGADTRPAFDPYEP